MTTLIENFTLKQADPGHMLPKDMQRSNEIAYSKQHLDKYLKTYLEQEELVQKIAEGIARLEDWLAQEYYESKNLRLAQVKTLNLKELVEAIYISSMYIRTPDTLVSVTSRMAYELKFDNHSDAIKTVAEIVGVLAWTGVYVLSREDTHATIMFKSAVNFPAELDSALQRAMYPLPMVCEPTEVKNNWDSGYLTFNDSIVLGKRNNHEGNLCLDVINLQNSIALKLDLDFLCSVEEEPSFALDDLQKAQNWNQFKWESYNVYSLIAKQGNKFYLTNKNDKRGRLYAQGYHITTQGSAFKKAMIELHNEEVVEGVPT